MFGWFKSKPRQVEPFIRHIVDSLKSNPSAWSLDEIREVASNVECAEDHPDAIKSKKRKYDNYYSLVDWWYRPVFKYIFRLKHTSGAIIIKDEDATTYNGWVIEHPRHTVTSKEDSDLLSEAVKEWREYMVLHELTKHTPEKKALDEAMAELESEMQ